MKKSSMQYSSYYGGMGYGSVYAGNTNEEMIDSKRMKNSHYIDSGNFPMRTLSM